MDSLLAVPHVDTLAMVSNGVVDARIEDSALYAFADEITQDNNQCHACINWLGTLSAHAYLHMRTAHAYLNELGNYTMSKST